MSITEGADKFIDKLGHWTARVIVTGLMAVCCIVVLGIVVLSAKWVVSWF